MSEKNERLLEILKRDAEKVAGCQDYNSLAGKTILITGASGLIGVNLLASLVEISRTIRGIKVVSVIHSEPLAYFSSLTEQPGFTVISGDLSDEKFLDSIPRADIIIHAAGFGQPNKFTTNPITTLKINTFSTFKLFEKLNEGGKFLFISSSDIYNGLEAEKYSESQIGTTNTDHFRACYIEGKRTGETICNLYRLQNVNSFSVRLSLTYGPGTRKNDQRVLPSLIAKGLNGKIDLLDSGKATRAFCYISDAIELLWHILLKGEHGLYNLGGVSKTSIRELGTVIGDILNVPVIIPDDDHSIKGAPKDVLLNMERLLAEYPKKKFVELREGLVNTIDWHKNLN